MRFGLGYDIHRLISTSEKSEIPLGGFKVPCFYEIEAHSDGDVLLHALVDGCLGALALGDIGQWFPDTKQENHKRPSAEFVKEVLQTVSKMNWKVSQVDCNLFLQEPKISGHWLAIRESMARLLDIELSNVSLKAKTMEGLDSIGQRKALAAQVLVVLAPVR